MQRNFISNNRGFTLTEVIVAMMMSASVMLGLMVALEVCLRSFQSAQASLALQQDGSYALEEFTRLIETADTISTMGNEFVFSVPSSDFSRHSQVVLILQGGRLFSGGRQLVPFPGGARGISIASIALLAGASTGSYRLRIVMNFVPGDGAPSDQKVFESEVLSRNVLINANQS